MIPIKKKRFPKKTIIAASIVAALALGAVTYVYTFDGNLFGWKSHPTTSNSNNVIDYGPATSDQQNAGTNTKTSPTDTPPAPTPIPSSTKKNVQVTITAANENGPVLQIRVLIGAVENAGTCTITLTRSGESSVTKTAGTQALSSTSTCQGFDIPISELSTGTWQALVTYDSLALTGSATKSITIQ